MRRTALGSLVILGVAGAMGCAARAPLDVVSARADDSLPHFLSGCWLLQRGAITTAEQWSTPRGGTMLGTSHTTRGDSTIEHEFMRIVRRGDSLVFVAQPSGQASTEFVATVRTTEALVFENPAHDFPQRVHYRSAGGDSLVARIEGTSAGRQRAVDFGYVRMSCPGSAR